MRDPYMGQRELIYRIVFSLLGVVLGFTCFLVYVSYPGLRGAVYFVCSMLVVILLFLIVKNKYVRDMSLYLHNLTGSIEKISAGERNIVFPEADIAEVHELYSAMETLRSNFIQQAKTKDVVLSIINALATNIELEKMLDELLPKLADGTKSNWSAFYSHNTATNQLELKGSIGFSKNIYKEFDVEIGDGIVGRVAKTKRIEIMTEIPEDTVYISKSFLGKVKPRAIMAIPILSQGELVGVLVLASIYDYHNEEIEVVKMVQYYLGVAVANGLAYERTQRLTNELQFQNKLIQNMNEELELKVYERTEFVNSVIDSQKGYAVISVDESLVISLWSKGAEHIFGYKRDEVFGTYLYELSCFNGMKDSIIESFSRAKKEDVIVFFADNKRKSGVEYYAEVSIACIYDAMGDTIGYSVVVRDIERFKEYTQKINIEAE